MRIIDALCLAAIVWCIAFMVGAIWGWGVRDKRDRQPAGHCPHGKVLDDCPECRH
jgi:hypothetical protein